MKDPAWDEELETLVATCLERMEDEGTSALEAVCAAHPAQAEDLRRRVGLLLRTNLLDSSALAARVPRSLGDFELREALGAGAMGVVHVAWQRSVGREVAVKLVRPELLLFPESRARFQRETMLVARLRHPAILPILAVGEESGLPWYATELVHGCSLAELLQRVRARFGSVRAVEPSRLLELIAPPGTGARHETTWRPPRTWREFVLGVALELARALAHAHGRGVLHRDVKPSNVLLSVDGRVFLSDFGLAADPADASLTRTGSAVGSLPYLAPELLEGRPADVRSDVYGLGAVLYELFTLRRPYEDASPPRLVARILSGDRVAPRKLVPTLGLDEEAVVLCAVERSPAARYPTASAFADDLENLLARRPTRARPAGPGLRLVRFVQRRPAASLAAALAVLLVVGGPLVLAWTQGRARQRLLTKNKELDAALAREAAERSRAEGNLGRAVEAVDLMLSRTGGALLEEVPQMQLVRTELLQAALRLYEDLLPQDPEDPALVLAAVALRLMAGEARTELGERETALEIFSGARALLAGCAACPAYDRVRYGYLQGKLLQRSGHLQSDRDPALSIALLEEAYETLAAPELPADERVVLAGMALADQLVRDERGGESMELLDDLAARAAALSPSLPHTGALTLESKLLTQRGTLHYFLGDDESAAADLRGALAALDELIELESDSAMVRRDRLIANINLSAALLRAQDVDGAAEAIAAARADSEWLVQAFPAAEPLLRRHAGVLVNEGLVLHQRGDSAGARAAWQRAVELGRPLTSTPQPSGESLLQLGLALNNLADLDREEERFDEALQHAEEAEAILGRAHALAPGDVLVGRTLESAHLVQGLSWIALGDTAEGLACVEAAVAVAPQEAKSQRVLVDAWLALAGAKPEQAADYEALAMEALHKAVSLGWKDAQDLLHTPELEPLRTRADFPQISTP